MDINLIKLFFLGELVYYNNNKILSIDRQKRFQ